MSEWTKDLEFAFDHGNVRLQLFSVFGASVQHKQDVLVTERSMHQYSLLNIQF